MDERVAFGEAHFADKDNPIIRQFASDTMMGRIVYNNATHFVVLSFYSALRSI